jgi:NADH dehydrogenase
MLGVTTDRSGRVCVDASMNVPGKERVFVVGDAASIIQDGHPLPGLAQVAIQSGAYVGRVIAGEITGRANARPFHYFDKGNLAVVGQNYALFERNEIRLSGFLAWLVWAFIHLAFLPQLQNRLRVEIQWLWTYFTGQRGSRLIPETPPEQRLSKVKIAKIS